MFYRIRRIRQFFPIRFHTEFLYFHNLENVEVIPAKVDLELSYLKSGEENRLLEVWKVNMEKVHQRLKRGDLCYLTYIDSKLASYHWIQSSGKHFIQQANRWITIKEREGWIFHVRVADWAQGKGINRFVYSKILKDAKEKGMLKVWIYTASFNKSNQKGIHDCGFILERKIYSVQLGKYFFRLFESIADK